MEDAYYLLLDYSPVLVGIFCAIVAGMATHSFWGGIWWGGLLAISIVLLTQKAADSAYRRVQRNLRRRR
jgi:hypothetical protein